MAGGQPSARTVNLKRIEDDALISTSALWITGEATLAERALAVELFAQRDSFPRVALLVRTVSYQLNLTNPLV